jgi:hypothetical protein
MPIEGAGEVEWLAEGRGLLARTRAGLGLAFKVVVTEPWWGKDLS